MNVLHFTIEGQPGITYVAIEGDDGIVRCELPYTEVRKGETILKTAEVVLDRNTIAASLQRGYWTLVKVNGIEASKLGMVL